MEELKFEPGPTHVNLDPKFQTVFCMEFCALAPFSFLAVDYLECGEEAILDSPGFKTFSSGR